MISRMVLIGLAVGVLSCGGTKTPVAPATPTGTIGARIDSSCSGIRFNVSTVTVTIDGVEAGSAIPGGAVTKIVPVGSHTVRGRANTGITWSADDVITTAANPDNIRFFACI